MTESEIEQRVMETEAREYAFWEAHSIGVKAERERIVNILETTGAEFLTRPELDELLGLIKGENK
jgi:hypothetical protein